MSQQIVQAPIQFVFIAGLLYRLVWIVVAGDMTAPVLKTGLLAAPLLIPVLLFGHWLSRRGSPAAFRRVVYVLIMLMGTGVIAKGIGAWATA